MKKHVPEPLTPAGLVKFEFIKMHDAHGFGHFNEAGQLIEVKNGNEKGLYSHIMLLDNFPAIAAGREVWGFPKKYAHPALTVNSDTLVGSIKYNSIDVAFGTMSYK